MNKQTGKEIGGIQQFAKFGGAKPTPAGPPAKPSHEIEKPTASHTPLVKEKASGEGKRERLVIYVDPDMAKWVKHQAVDQGQSITDIVVAWLKEIREREG